MTPDETRVRIRAYAIWEAEGRPHGRDEAHWLEALSQILAEEAAALAALAAPEPPVKKAPARKVAAAKPVKAEAKPVKAEAKPVKEAPKKLAKAVPVEPVPLPAKKPSRTKASPAP